MSSASVKSGESFQSCSLMWYVIPLPQQSSTPEQSLQNSSSWNRCVMGFVAEKDEIKKFNILVDLGGTRNRSLYMWTVTKKSSTEEDSSMVKFSISESSHIHKLPSHDDIEIYAGITGCIEEVIRPIFHSLLCFCRVDKRRMLRPNGVLTK